MARRSQWGLANCWDAYLMKECYATCHERMNWRKHDSSILHAFTGEKVITETLLYKFWGLCSWEDNRVITWNVFTKNWNDYCASSFAFSFSNSELNWDVKLLLFLKDHFYFISIFSFYFILNSCLSSCPCLWRHQQYFRFFCFEGRVYYEYFLKIKSNRQRLKSIWNGIRNPFTSVFWHIVKLFMNEWYWLGCKVGVLIPEWSQMLQCTHFWWGFLTVTVKVKFTLKKKHLCIWQML